MYYPKSQIIENLYTNGGELKAFNSNEDYVGPYYKTSNNEFFTGKNPSDKPNIPLELRSPGTTPLGDPTVKSKNNITNYKESKESEPVGENMYLIDTNYYRARNLPSNRGDAPRPPIKYETIPTENDYLRGQYTRFFVKKGNENLFIEISQNEYKKFKEKSPEVQVNLYTPISLTWDLTGTEEEVYNNNKGVVSLIERRNKLYGFELSFKEKFSKYWRG